jgi:hypothetical protein
VHPILTRLIRAAARYVILNYVTIKATSLLAILIIWGSVIPAMALEPEAWWSAIFAALATAAIGISAWRRIGLARVLAIAGIWAGTAAAMARDADATWMSIFAFLATGAVVYGIMRRDGLLVGLGVAATWAMAGAVAARDADAAWISILAFLTTGALANSRWNPGRGLAAIAWWGAAGAVMLATEDWYWLCIPAFLLTAAAIPFGGLPRPRMPGKFEWDLFDRDDRDSHDDPRGTHGRTAPVDVSPRESSPWRGFRGQR